MRFKVYFQYGEREEEKDFLKEFDSLEKAESYRNEQIEMEGWNTDDETDQSYAKQYQIIDTQPEKTTKMKI